MWKESGAQSDRWSRRFSVGPTALHPRGFTLYRLTSYVFPKSSPEAITVVTVWKRFSDLHKLQHKICKIHKDLHLSGSCPSYFKWNYFKRFDCEVVEERVKNTQLLLDFIASHPPLFTSADFVHFFQSSYPDPSVKHDKNQLGNIEEIRNSLLLPIDSMKPLEYQSSEEDSPSMTDSYSISMTDSISINSSMNFKECPTQQSQLSEIDKPETNENNNISENVPSPGNMDIKSKLKDSFLDKQKSCIQNVSYKSNLPDLISFNNISSMDISLITNNDESTCDLSLIYDDKSSNGIESVPNPILHKESKLITNFSSINLEDCEENHKEKERLMAISKESKHGDNIHNKVATIGQLQASLTGELNSKIDLQENYVFEAGYLLSLGAKNEGKGDYQAAFDSYKFGIEKLLIGVQGDTDEFRRNFVKEKVAKYLSHAEKIYSSYLSSDTEMVDKTSFSQLVSVNDYKPKYNFDTSDYSQPYESLSKYRVLNILSEQVMLVLCSETQQSYAMKVIQKSCNSVSDDDYFSKGHMENTLPILPIDVPYMVKLKSFVETPNLLFLVLQYASGGKLFDYIHNYAKSIPNTPAREVNLENIFINVEDIEQSNKATKSDELVYFKDDNDIERKDLNSTEIWKNHNLSMSVNDLVSSSQKLLSNVDNILSGHSITNVKDNKNTHRKINLGLKETIEEKSDDLHNTSQCSSYKHKCALPPKSICKWSAEFLTAIEHLHKYDIVCRTLQPKNLLLSEGGHLMLTYFIGRDLEDIVLPFCETPHYNLYIAPELRHYSFWRGCGDLREKLCDYWSYGAILYELIVGVPLSSMHPCGFNSHTILQFPDDISDNVKDLLSRLLEYEPSKRLGSGHQEIEEIKSHPYFNDIDWDSL